MSLPFKRSYYYCIFILQPGEGAYSWVCSQRSWAMSLHLCHPVQTFPRRGSLFTIIYFDQENPKIQKVTKLLAMPLQLCHSVHASPKIGQSVAHSYLYSKHSENTHLKSLSLSFQFALAVDFNSSVYVWTHLPWMDGFTLWSVGHSTMRLSSSSSLPDLRRDLWEAVLHHLQAAGGYNWAKKIQLRKCKI